MDRSIKAFLWSVIGHVILFFVIGSIGFGYFPPADEPEEYISVLVDGEGFDLDAGGGGGNDRDDINDSNPETEISEERANNASVNESAYQEELREFLQQVEKRKEQNKSMTSVSNTQNGSANQGNRSGGGEGTGSGDGRGSGSGGGSGSGKGGGHGDGIGQGKGSGVQGAGISPPQILSKIEPKYPKEAIDEGVTGSVTLEISVSTSGEVKAVEIISSSGYRSLDQAVVTAVWKWRFVPAKNRATGQAIAARTRIPVRFELRHKNRI